MKSNIENKKEFMKEFHKNTSYAKGQLSFIGSPEDEKLEYLQFRYNNFKDSHSEPHFKKYCINLQLDSEGIYKKCKNVNGLKTEIENFCKKHNLPVKLNRMGGFSIVLGKIDTKNKKFSEQVDEFIRLNLDHVPSINHIIDSYI